jgi:hypothetical protein
MNYPEDFPEHLHAPVDAAISQAEIDFSAARRTDSWGELEANRYILKYVFEVYFAFAYQACKAEEQGHWSGERVRQATKQFMRTVTVYVLFEKRPDANQYTLNSFLNQAKLVIEASGEWSKLQAEMKRVAEARGLQQPLPETERAAIQLEPPPVNQTKPVRRAKQIRVPKPELLAHTETVNRKVAADALGVTVRTIDRHIGDGKLVPVGAIGRKRLKTKDLLNILNRKPTVKPRQK